MNALDRRPPFLRTGPASVVADRVLAAAHLDGETASNALRLLAQSDGLLVCDINLALALEICDADLPEIKRQLDAMQGAGICIWEGNGHRLTVAFTSADIY